MESPSTADARQPVDPYLYRASSLREKILEHQFIATLLQALWCSGMRQVELLRAEVDSGGYDLLLDCNGIQRYIQLKSSHADARTNRVNVNCALQAKANGCVIWLIFDAQTMEITKYLWFGNRPGEQCPPLGQVIGRHTKADQCRRKTQRPTIRVVKRSAFKKLETIGQLAAALFGSNGDWRAQQLPSGRTPSRNRRALRSFG